MARNNINTLLSNMQHPGLNLIEPGLERVERFLSLIGSPHKRLPPVVHVAGTNGKGSLIAYLDAILKSAGYTVHRYTSPHLMKFNERIHLAGKQIDDDYLRELLERVSKYIDRQPVTYFESTTAAAFLAFSERPADILLLEVGMGGRLDATNVVEWPLLTVISPVAADHCKYLGNTLTEIAGEKAGIMKQRVPCVVGKQEDEAAKVIENVAQSLSVPLFRRNYEWQIFWQNERAIYQSPSHTMVLQPSLAGRHQYDNAATAVACIDMLEEAFPVSDEHITRGLAKTVWPARLQRLTQGKYVKMLPPGMELWIDGAHNPQGGEVLAGWLSEQAASERYLICGMLRDKDSIGFLRPLARVTQGIYSVSIPDEPFSLASEELEARAREAGSIAVCAPSIENALQTIAERARTPAIICICGSLYLAGKVLAANKRK